MRYAVLGGAGSMGRIVVRDLLEFSEPKDEVVIADYDEGAARALADALPKKHAKVFATRVDVRDATGARAALEGSFVIINCVQFQLNLEVMQLALAVGAHYVDLGGLFHMTRRLLDLDQRFRDAGRLALLGMGAAPGITNVLAADGCSKLDRVQEIHTRVAGADKTKYKFLPALPLSYSLQTILEELSVPPAVFTRGRLHFVEPMSGRTRQQFPAPIGPASPMYTLHSEVATLPLSFADKGVREVSFKIAFDEGFLEKVQFLRDLGLASEQPVRLGDAEVKPIEVVNRVALRQPKPVPRGPLRQHEVIRAVVKGVHRSKKVTWVLDCQTAGMPKWGIGTDIDTGSPPAIAARMLARGHISALGAVPPERAVPVHLFYAELERRGMRVTASRRSGWAFRV